MIGLGVSRGRSTLCLLVIVILVGTAAPIAGHAGAATSVRRPIDLAAMVPHPLDIPGGFRLDRAYVHTALAPSADNPLFYPAQWGSRINERTIELLRRTGWQQTYSNSVAVPEPINPDAYGQGIRFSVSEFAGEDEAIVARDGLASLLREIDFRASPVVLRTGVFATLAVYHYPEGVNEPFLLFTVGEFLATVEFINSVSASFTAADVVLIGAKFLEQIEEVIAGTDTTLGGYALRLREGDHLRLSNEWYLRRDGRDLPRYLDDRERQVLQMALGEATDVYAMDPLFTGGESMTAVQNYLFRFPTEEALQEWLPLWRLYVAIWSWDQTETTVAGIPAGQQMVFSLSDDVGERWSGNMIVAWHGREAVMVNVIGIDSLNAASTLAKTQLDCLHRSVACEPVIFPPADVSMTGDAS